MQQFETVPRKAKSGLNMKSKADSKREFEKSVEANLAVNSDELLFCIPEEDPI